MRYVAVADGMSLSHHGIKGQKWGHRRFQNYDRSLTPEGRERYGLKQRRDNKKLQKQYQNFKDKEQEYNENTAKYKQHKNQYYTKLSGEKSDKIYKELDAYVKKNKSYWPDEDGPMYKSKKDFINGKIDKVGTALADKYEAAVNYESTRDSDFNKMLDYENKAMNSLASAGSEQKKFRELSRQYVDKYGQRSLDSLNLSDSDVNYSNKFIDSYIDDSIAVTSNSMDKNTFNRKYQGTGVKAS